ncbi:MAG: single-stranded DNA-binding protein [Clostridia bacterium]|nr:single-stranded DNA-binding protein [Clostridia bacterium]
MQTRCGDGSVMICGILGKDAETKRVGEKNAVLTKFSVKVGERAVEGVDKKQAVWVNCTAWNDIGKAASTLKKGDSVFVIGKIRKYLYNGNDGQQHEGTELVCEFVSAVIKSLLPDVPYSENAGRNEQEYSGLASDEDLPF